MTTKNHFVTILGSIALAACLAYAGPSAYAQSYSVTNLGVLPKKVSSTPAAINNQAQVTGTSGMASDQSIFCYDSPKKGMEDVSVIPGSISRGFSINGYGVMVGDSTFGNGKYSRAAMFVKGTVADLGTLGPAAESYSRANGINGSGQVVGYCGSARDSSASRAFAWSAFTGMFDLGTLGGVYAQAFAINDAGFVTGTSQTPKMSGATHAFLYQLFSKKAGPAPERMRDLGTLGGNSSYGMFINANNHVVGYSETNYSDNRVHAFLNDGEKMRDLGTLGGNSSDSDQSVALGINAADQVVGYTYSDTYRLSPPIPAFWQVAFVYNKGVMMDLNGLIGTESKNYWLYSATAINDQGQIVANAMDYQTNNIHAVLLTPMN